MTKKKGLKYESFDITEEEFYLYTKDLPQLHKSTEKGDEYELYGLNSSAPIKYKNYKKDGKDLFCIYQTVPQEITCGRCHIKLNTEYHDNCGMCLTSFNTLLKENRGFNDECADFKNELNTELQGRYTKELKVICKKWNQSFDMLTTN